MKKIKTLIIGLGKISVGYNDYNRKDILTHVKALKNNLDFKLIACVEKNKKKGINFKKKYKIDVYNSLSKLKNKIFPDLAIIASNTDSHIKLINEILDYHPSISTILCEKPFGNNFVDAYRVLKKCKTKKVKLFVNYIRRADPGAIKISQILNKNFKKPIKGVVFYDGNVLNQASHIINLLQFWFGKTKNVIKIDNQKNKSLGCNFELDFNNTKVFFIALNIKNYSYASVELISPSGRMNYTERGFKIFWQNIQFDTIFGEDKLPSKNIRIIKNDMKNYQLNVLKELYKAILNKNYNLCTGNEALETIKIINKIDKTYAKK